MAVSKSRVKGGDSNNVCWFSIYFDPLARSLAQKMPSLILYSLVLSFALLFISISGTRRRIPAPRHRRREGPSGAAVTPWVGAAGRVHIRPRTLRMG